MKQDKEIYNVGVDEDGTLRIQFTSGDGDIRFDLVQSRKIYEALDGSFGEGYSATMDRNYKLIEELKKDKKDVFDLARLLSPGFHYLLGKFDEIGEASDRIKDIK